MMIRTLSNLKFISIMGICIFAFSGCADFFAEKPTEVETENILRDLSRIRVLPDPNVIEPSIFTKPPRIIQGKDDAKLFYFVRHHTVAEIALLMQQQYAYPVSQNLATNQLIVKCPTIADANATLGFLQQVDVPPVQVRIDCIVSEVFADSTMDWETTLRVNNLFGEGIKLTGKETGGLNVDGTPEVLPAFPGASIRDSGRSQMGLKVGYMHGDNFLALIDMLVSKGYLKIMMSPSLEVVNGKTARIEATNKQPLQKEVTSAAGLQLPYNVTEYYDVIDSLVITPHVFADGYIGLETKVILGSSSTPQGVKQIPIITKREIENKENRIRQGESLVIGGIKKTIKRSVVRGVPLLKDIPLLGILFSSKDAEDQATEILFIITPTISSGGIPQANMAKNLARKHDAVAYKETLTETILDPLGLQAKAEERKRAAAQTEDDRINEERIRLRTEKAEAESRKLRMLSQEAEIEKEKAAQLKSQALIKDAEAANANATAAQAAAEAQRAASEAQKAKGQADEAKSQAAAKEAERLAAEAQKIAAQAQQIKAEADKAAESSREAAAKAEAQKAQAQAEAAKAQAEVEKAKAEAEKAASEAESERARVEALRSAARQKQVDANETDNDPNVNR